MAYGQLAAKIDAAHPRQIDDLLRELWAAHAAGHVQDHDAQDLAELLHQRRNPAREAQGVLFPTATDRKRVSELAVLRIVSDEFLQHGACDRSLAELAARAGCCRKLAQRKPPPNVRSNPINSSAPDLLLWIGEWLTNGC